MEVIKNGISIYAEEKIIDNSEQIFQELREQIITLQNELTEQEKHADKMDDLVWESLKIKERLEREIEELKLNEKNILDQLKDDNKETNIKEILDKRKEIKELKEKLEKEGEKEQEEMDTTGWYDLGEITVLPYLCYPLEIHKIKIEPKIFPKLLVISSDNKEENVVDNVEIKEIKLPCWMGATPALVKQKESEMTKYELEFAYGVLKLQKKILNLDEPVKFRVKVEKEEDVYGYTDKNELVIRNNYSKVQFLEVKEEN